MRTVCSDIRNLVADALQPFLAQAVATKHARASLLHHLISCVLIREDGPSWRHAETTTQRVDQHLHSFGVGRSARCYLQTLFANGMY